MKRYDSYCQQPNIFETIFFGIDFILFFYFERENIWDIIRDIRIELVSYRIMR